MTEEQSTGMTMTEPMAAAEMRVKERWVEANLMDAGAPAFSFVYDGEASESLLPKWRRKVRRRQLDDRRKETTLAWTDPKTGMEVRCVATDDADHPVVEWLLRFTNRGGSDSPILERIRVLDTVFTDTESSLGAGAGGDFVLHRALGDGNSARSFEPIEEPLPANDPNERVFAPSGGRSSDGVMPYFNIRWRGGGTALAVGWSGQWEAGFRPLDGGGLRVRAGQQATHFRLHAGETVRSPRIVLAFWRGGDDLRGNNLFRRFMLARWLPKRNEKPVLPPICGSVAAAAPDGSYEKPHLDAVAPMKERGIEVFWSDMDPQQWYPGGFPNGTGTWEVDRAKYPNGLAPIGDAIRAAGMEYLLWFEPERVHPGTKIDREHPEWVMKEEGEWSRLFRLHDAKAREWLTDLIDSHVTAARLSWIRWDFNIAPLGFWRRNDAPDRQGITEIRHVKGLYAMWEELMRRHPGLVIDNCAGGGRRLDIEALRFGLPLWHSDLQCEGSHPAADQLQNGALYRWLPLHGCGNFGLEPSYAFRSAMTAGNILCAGVTDPGREAEVKRTVALYHRLRPYMLGDFHPLFPHHAGEEVWYGWQFHRPGPGDGLVQLFRRKEARDAEKRVRLHQLDPDALYELTDIDTNAATRIAGRELIDSGLPAVLPQPESSAIVLYQRVKE